MEKILASAGNRTAGVQPVVRRYSVIYLLTNTLHLIFMGVIAIVSEG
jgi:hypothetical protein